LPSAAPTVPLPEIEILRRGEGRLADLIGESVNDWGRDPVHRVPPPRGPWRTPCPVVTQQVGTAREGDPSRPPLATFRPKVMMEKLKLKTTKEEDVAARYRRNRLWSDRAPRDHSARRRHRLLRAQGVTPPLLRDSPRVQVAVRVPPFQSAPGYADIRRDAPRGSRFASSIWASARCWVASRLSSRAVDVPIASWMAG